MDEVRSKFSGITKQLLEDFKKENKVTKREEQLLKIPFNLLHEQYN